MLHDIMLRDQQDAGRKSAPLKQAEDAVLADTTGNTLEESYQQLLTIVKEHLSYEK